MKKIFTLLALFTLYGSSIAGTVSLTQQVHSLEGLAGVTANQTSNQISYTIADDYIVGDKIILTFPDGPVSSSFTFQPSITVAPAAAQGLTLTLLSSDSSSATYQVTAITGAATTGAVINFGSVNYSASILFTTTLTVTVSSEHSAGAAFDTAGTRTGRVAKAHSQFGTVSVNPSFDNIISQSSNLLFDPDSADTMTWRVANPYTAGWLNVATVSAANGTQVVLSGNAGSMTGLTRHNFSTTAGTTTLDVAAATHTTAYSGMVTTDTVTFTAPGSVALQAQAFTLDVVYKYTSAGGFSGTKTLATGLAAGQWSDAPGAPTIGAGTAGNTIATIAFTAPVNNGGSVITGYTAACGAGTPGTGTTFPLTVTGLTNGSAYNCSVIATNAAGSGPASATVSITPTDAGNVTLPNAGGGTGEEVTYTYTSTAGSTLTISSATVTPPTPTDPVPASSLTTAIDINSSSPGNNGYSIVIIFTISASSDALFTGYWKYGPENGGADRWYDYGTLTANGNGTGYEISDGGKTLKVHLTDGIRGDDDLVADGSIIDPGMLIVKAAIATAIPTLSVWSLLTLSALIALFGINHQRKKAV